MKRLSSQLGMFPREATASTLMAPYVPVLLIKRGEREALSRLSAAALGRVTPWMRVVPPELRSTEDDTQPAGEFSRLAAILGDRAVYLDVVGTPRRDRALPPLDGEYLDRMLSSATAAGLAFAPVYPLGRADLAPVVARHAQAELGAAVLVTPASAFTWGARSLTEKVRSEAGALDLEGPQLDLMVDLGYLRDGSDDPESAAWLVRAAADAYAWRSILVAATSVPDSLADEIPQDSLNGIERREVRLFEAIRTRMASALRYADYVVQHPVPPVPGPTPKMRASIRYTAGSYMFASRGGRPIGEVAANERAEHYRELATRLRDHPPFIGADCCWGDATIEALADGRAAHKSQEKMRALATCHHITTVAEERVADLRLPAKSSERASDRAPAAARVAAGPGGTSRDARARRRRG